MRRGFYLLSFIKSIKRVFVFKFWGLWGLWGLKGLRGSLFSRHPYKGACQYFAIQLSIFWNSIIIFKEKKVSSAFFIVSQWKSS